jgi:hypothetical protein
MGKATEYTRVAVDKLIPYANNAKQHSDSQVTKIASSIREFGFLNPVLIDASYNVIAGHGRILAAKKLQMDEVPCLFVEGLTDAQRKAYILADNRLSELGEWDMNLVGLELGELDADGFDVDLLGFDNIDLDEEYGTDFSLPDGDKPEIVTMTFTLHEEQKGLIEYAMEAVKDDATETFGNTNKNGNALYEVVRQWAEQRR